MAITPCEQHLISPCLSSEPPNNIVPIGVVIWCVPIPLIYNPVLSHEAVNLSAHGVFVSGVCLLCNIMRWAGEAMIINGCSKLKYLCWDLESFVETFFQCGRRGGGGRYKMLNNLFVSNL